MLPQHGGIELAEARGINRARRAGSQAQFRYPRLRLKAGDRARFWFLSGGEDEFFDGQRFHLFKQQTRGGKTYSKEVLCVRLATDGDERCASCEDGHEDMGLRFAVWAYVDYILHLGDNPDQEGQAWEQVRLKAAGGDERKGRILFKEEVGQSILIWLAYGKEWVWFEQVMAAFNKYGTLKDHLYELKRVGEKMSDTDYTFQAVKAGKISKEAAKKVKETELTPVDEVFRETVTGGPVAQRPTRLESELPEDESAEEEEPEAEAEAPEEGSELPEVEEPGQGDLI